MVMMMMVVMVMMVLVVMVMMVLVVMVMMMLVMMVMMLRRVMIIMLMMRITKDGDDANEENKDGYDVNDKVISNSAFGNAYGSKVQSGG